jgi:hypothetical protein
MYAVAGYTGALVPTTSMMSMAFDGSEGSIHSCVLARRSQSHNLDSVNQDEGDLCSQA